MRIEQTTLTLPPFPRGFHLITDHIIEGFPAIGDFDTAMLHLFLQHTSASLSLNENADPTVRRDLEALCSDLFDDKAYYRHTYEGTDDMPAHVKSAMLGVSLNLPVTKGRLNLGTWQGIYLGEHRDRGGSRRIVATLTGR